MSACKALLASIGAACVFACAGPVMADDFGFGFSYRHGRSCRPPARTYVYREYTPVVYDAPDVVVYDPPPRFYYFRDCAPRATVVYRDCGPRYFRSSTTYVRGYHPAAHRAYRYHGNDRVRVRAHVRW